ncbi:hypothetical protein [Actinomycetospora flava]|uniref:GAF domain-containing protein n=1 Tax=Actinomycetospora flava TaxID=3129232 RepID=A0ABU8M7P5_9PSEU
MGRGGEAAQSPLRARVRAEVDASRALRRRAEDRARAQRGYTATVDRRARAQRARAVNAWPSAHGLVAHADTLRYEDVLALVLEAATALYGGCRSVSLTSIDQLSGDQCSYSTVASTGESGAVDAAQYRLDEGPCIDAAEMDLVASVRADDLASVEGARFWPRFSEAAGMLGVRSSLSISVPWSAFRVGLQADQHAVGAINFYGSEAHAFDRSEVQAAMLGAWVGSILSGREPAEVYEGTPA